MSEILKPQQKRCSSGTELRSNTVTELHSTQDIHSALPAFRMLKDAALYSLVGGFNAKTLLKFARGVEAAKFGGGPESSFDVWWTFGRKRVEDSEENREHLLVLYRATVARLKPLKASAIGGAIDYANTAPAPKGFSGTLAKLANGCIYLQKLCGAEPFFLSVRGAGVIMGMKNPFHASAYLLELERRDFIELVEKGTNEGRKASRYRLLKQ